MVAAAGLMVAASANAETVELGSVGTLEYFKATLPGVTAQEGPVADCDDGDFATGGGGTISGSPADAALNATVPSSFDADGWQAEGSTTGLNARKATTYAICGNAELSYSNAGGNVEPAGEVGDVTGTTQGCSESETVLGGFEGSGGDVRIVQTRPIGAADWSITVQNHAAVQGSYAMWYGCSVAYDVTRRAESTTVKRDEAGKATATCRRSEAVINGGLAMTAGGMPQVGTWATATRPFDSDDRKKTPDDGWTAKAYNDSNARIALTAYAVCAAK